MLYLFTTKIPPNQPTNQPSKTWSRPAAPVHELRVSPTGQGSPPPHHSPHQRDRRVTARAPPVTLPGPPQPGVPTAGLPHLPQRHQQLGSTFCQPERPRVLGRMQRACGVGWTWAVHQMPLYLPEPQFPFQRGDVSNTGFVRYRQYLVYRVGARKKKKLVLYTPHSHFITHLLHTHTHARAPPRAPQSPAPREGMSSEVGTYLRWCPAHPCPFLA